MGGGGATAAWSLYGFKNAIAAISALTRMSRHPASLYTRLMPIVHNANPRNFAETLQSCNMKSEFNPLARCRGTVYPGIFYPPG